MVLFHTDDVHPFCVLKSTGLSDRVERFSRSNWSATAVQARSTTLRFSRV